jgi:hypothetical protein
LKLACLVGDHVVGDHQFERRRSSYRRLRRCRFCCCCFCIKCVTDDAAVVVVLGEKEEVVELEVKRRQMSLNSIDKF